MKGGTMYARIVPADRDRGYVMMVSWSKPVVQRTCQQQRTMSAITRKSIDDALEQFRIDYGVMEVQDLTDPGLKRKLAKLFGEEVPKKVDA